MNTAETKNMITDMLRITAREALTSGVEFADALLKSVEEAVSMLSRDPNVQSVFEDPQAWKLELCRFWRATWPTHEDAENAFLGGGMGSSTCIPYPPGGLLSGI